MPHFYAYEPSFAAAVVFIVVFFILSAVHAFQIVKNRTWFFIPFLIGCLLEAAGYIGRAIGAKETPDWTLTPFAIQIILLLLGPTFYAASIYMILGRLVRLLNAEKYSLIRPSWLTKFFLLGDIISIAAQALGGGMLSNAKTKTDFERGETIIILGLAIQVVFFGLFMLVTCLFHYRLRQNPSAESCRDDVQWEKFLIVLYVTGILILIRSIFRMIEYIQGSENVLQTSEVYIYIFDATLMAIVAMIFVYYHPSKFMVLPQLPLHISDGGEELGPYDAVPLSTGYHNSYGRIQ